MHSDSGRAKFQGLSISRVRPAPGTRFGKSLIKKKKNSRSRNPRSINLLLYKLLSTANLSFRAFEILYPV